MFRWLLVVFLALLLLQGLSPWLNKLGFGRLPGDMRFRLFGREFFILKTMMFHEITTVLNGRKHLKMVIRSVPDSLSLFLG